MAEHNNLYQYVTYYDFLFDRDVSREVDFITALYHHHTGGRLRAVLEIACGPGYHTRTFARQGKRAVGLDLNPAMIELAAGKAEAEGLVATWLRADMRDFRLDAPVDMAYCMFDGLDALINNDDLIHHFRTIADNLTPAGLYLIDLSHPRECSYTYYKPFVYTAERDGRKVEIRWATNQPKYDLVTNVAYVELEMYINDHGQETIIKDSAYERLMFPQEIRLLAEQSGAMQLVACYGDFKLDQPLDDSPASSRMIIILQKTGVISENVQ